MTSAEDHTSEGPTSRNGGEAGDWTAWLRSRLERVAAPERRQDVSPSDHVAGGEPEQTADEPLAADQAAAEHVADEQAAAEQAADEPVAAEQEPVAAEHEPVAAEHEPVAAQQQAAEEEQAADAAAGTVRPARRPAPIDRPDSPTPHVPLARQEPPPASLDVAGDRTEGAPTRAGRGGRLGWNEPRSAVPAHELVAGLDRLQSAVNSLSARVDGLADAVLTFRSVMHERLDEYTQTVLRAAKAGASDVQEYRRMHTASLSELRRNANDTADTLRRLTGWMEELARIQGDDERWATALSQAFEEAAAERRAEGSAGDAALPLAERLQQVERALAGLTEELAGDPPDPLVPVVKSLADRLEHIEQALDQLARADQDREPSSAAVALTEEQLAAIATAIADRLHARTSPDLPQPQPARSNRAPATGSQARARRTTPIRAPSRSPSPSER